MANVFFDNPPVTTGDEKNQLLQLRMYLNAMSDKLNEAMNSISIEQMDTDTAQKIRTASGEKVDAEVNTLKSLIIKSAEIVRHEMDEITSHLEDNYEALSSQFGEYERNLTNDITITAEGILQDYRYEERIQGLEDEAGNTDVFINRTNQYIYSGLIGNGKYGIAIGENVTNADGTLNSANKCATFTMDELAFYQGDTKLAWFSNSVFHIERGEIEKSLKMGNHTWQVFADGSMALIKG